MFAAGMCMFATCTFAARVSAQQSEPMSTDRPDYTNGVDVVHKTQLELGYTFTRIVFVNQQSIGELLLRVPLTKNAEFRLAPNGLIATSVFGSTQTAMQDAVVGTKIHLTENTGVILDTSLPTGSAPTGGRGTTPEAVFSARLPLSNALTAATNAGISWNREASGRSGAFNGSIELAYDVSDRTGAYLEAFGTDLTRDQMRTSFVNAGVLQQVGANSQIDFRIGHGINSTHAWFIGAGIAKRW
jgi:hypothetical protein